MNRKGNKNKKKEQKIKEKKQNIKSNKDENVNYESLSETIVVYIIYFVLSISVCASLFSKLECLKYKPFHYFILTIFGIYLIFFGILYLSLKAKKYSPEKKALKFNFFNQYCSLTLLSLLLFMTVVSPSVQGKEFIDLVSSFLKISNDQYSITFLVIFFILAILKVMKDLIETYKNWNVIIQEEKKAFENKNKSSYRILRIKGAKNMKAVADIEKEFDAILSENNQETKDEKLVALMNQLEKDYGTFKIAINNAELDTTKVNNQAMRLYAKISASREFEKTIDK